MISIGDQYQDASHLQGKTKTEATFYLVFRRQETDSQCKELLYAEKYSPFFPKYPQHAPNQNSLKNIYVNLI